MYNRYRQTVISLVCVALTVLSAQSHATPADEALSNTVPDLPADVRGFLALLTSNRGKAFCAPSTVTIGDAAAVVKRYVEQHPELHHRYTDQQALQALATAYPCNVAPGSNITNIPLNQTTVSPTGEYATIAAKAAAVPAVGLRAGADATPTHVVIGDSVPSVRQALRTSALPTETAGGGRSVGGEIRLPDRGIWVFFNAANQAYQFRFDAPFGGDIHGARIGVSIEQVQEVLGVPVKELAFTSPQMGRSYLYRVDPDTTIRCDFDNYQRLTTIRVLTGAVTFVETNGNSGGVSADHQHIAVLVTQQGKITHLTIPGSLAVTRNFGCVALDGIDNSVQPPDLYDAVPACIAAERYPDAIALFMLAGLETRFDAARVTDKTAGQAGQVMIMNTFNPLPQEQRQKFYDRFKAAEADLQTVSRVCDSARRLGPPTYYPDYMILHGIKAFTADPHADALDANFDAKAVWTELQRTYLNCATAR